MSWAPLTFLRVQSVRDVAPASIHHWVEEPLDHIDLWASHSTHDMCWMTSLIASLLSNTRGVSALSSTTKNWASRTPKLEAGCIQISCLRDPLNGVVHSSFSWMVQRSCHSPPESLLPLLTALIHDPPWLEGFTVPFPLPDRSRNSRHNRQLSTGFCRHCCVVHN